MPPGRHDGESGPQALSGGPSRVRVAGVVHTSRGATAPAKGRRRGRRRPRNRLLPSQTTLATKRRFSPFRKWEETPLPLR